MYRPEEVEALGLRFGQVVCHPVGHMGYVDIPQPFPSEQVVETFFNEVEHEEGLVAVHCSHGLNRTGYLIIRYLVDRLGVEPEEAIRRFNKARGFPLQRASILHYITSRGWLKQEGQEGMRHSKQEGKMAEEHFFTMFGVQTQSRTRPRPGTRPVDPARTRPEPAEEPESRRGRWLRSIFTMFGVQTQSRTRPRPGMKPVDPARTQPEPAEKTDSTQESIRGEE